MVSVCWRRDSRYAQTRCVAGWPVAYRGVCSGVHDVKCKDGSTLMQDASDVLMVYLLVARTVMDPVVYRMSYTVLPPNIQWAAPAYYSTQQPPPMQQLYPGVLQLEKKI